MHYKIIDRLYALNPHTVKLGLKNITELLKNLGNPHKRLSTIHIAGTNGKGSTAYFLNSIFHTAGYKTGLFLSPHLIDVRERITICCKQIPEDRFSELTEYIFYFIEKNRLTATFFEFITALAFLYFHQEKIDIGIIEVGLGGRLDATNVLDPLVSIITEIGLEHTRYLGSTIKEVALEKGGIIKSGGTVFISTENNIAFNVLKKLAEKKGALFCQYGKDYLAENIIFPSVSTQNKDSANQVASSMVQTFSLKYKKKTFKQLHIKTAGTCQIKNSSTAGAVALFLNKKFRTINEKSIREGLINTRLPCRMEVVGKAPLIILDAAHNHQAIQLLIKDIPHYFSYKRLIAVLGILEDKDYKKIIKVLSSGTNTFIMTEPKTDRVLPVQFLYKEALALKKKTFVEKKISKALIKAKAIANPEDLILVTGSFYTVGNALSELSQFNKLTSCL